MEGASLSGYLQLLLHKSSANAMGGCFYIYKYIYIKNVIYILELLPSWLPRCPAGLSELLSEGDSLPRALCHTCGSAQNIPSQETGMGFPLFG